jgi:perosamine synthetase
MIPICKPCLEGKEIEYVNQALSENNIGSQGDFIRQFELEFASYCGSEYGIGVTSGTTALHLVLSALGIGENDEVICPTFTMIAPLLAVKYTGASPVLVDADETWCIDPEKIEEKITKRTKAIIAVHIYGHPCDMDRINKIARRYKLRVIEDAAEAHGSLYKGFKAGSLSDASCFSFYANKIITTGEGGMVCTNSRKLARTLLKLKNLYFVKKRYYHPKIGFNYRMTNIQAAIGLAQLHRIDHYIYLRKKVAKYYTDHLQLPHQPEKNWAVSCNWYYGILVNDKLKLEKKLKENGIETRPFFVGMHKQPCLKLKGKYPVSDRLERMGILLPTGNLTNEELKYICDTIRS